MDVPQRFHSLEELIFDVLLKHAEKIGSLRGPGYAIGKIRIVRVRHLQRVNQRRKKSKQTQNNKKMKWFKRKPTTQPPVETHVTGSKIPLVKIFTEPDGTDWFEYQNPMTIPAKRAIAAEVATRFAEMNMTNDQLKTLIESMKRSANTGNIVEMFHVLTEMEFRLEFIGEEQTMVELAACYFVIDGENETEFSDVWKQIKLDRIKSNPQVFDFFVQRAFAHTTKYSEMSPTDIHEYLRANAPANERFRQILQRLKSGDTLTKSNMSTKSFVKTA